MPQVQMWKTSDGTIFESQAEHDAHESRLSDAQLVESFLDTQEFAKPAVRTKAKKSIMAFLDWRNRAAEHEADTREAAAA